MDFGLSEDQRLLDETLRAFLADRVPIDVVRAERDRLLEAPETGIDRALWARLAELGMTGVLVPEEQDGSGLSLLDAALVAQALGHAVAPTPFLASGVMAPVALRTLATPEAEGELRALATGERIVGVAATELFAVREDAGLRLEGDRVHGKAMMALGGVGADALLLPIGRDRLALVAAEAPGLTQTRLATVDATRCTSELLCEGVPVLWLAEEAGSAIERMLLAGRIALAADTFGACEAMIARSVAYAADRTQFGRPIGSFQAVKHMCAEMIADLEPVRSLVWYAAHCFDALPDEAPLMAHHALAHGAEVAREIASTATQVHGGVGWTDEQNLHFWFKRVATNRHLLGSPTSLREGAAALQDFGA